MMHGEALGDQVLHDNDSDILGVAGVTVETKELGQESPEVLMEIQVVRWKDLLKESRLFVAYGLADDFIVLGDIEYGA